METPYVNDMSKMNQTGITYAQFIQKLLKSQPNANVITVPASQICPKTGSIMDKPNTSIDGEQVSEVGNTLDGPKKDDDQLRRRLIMHYWR